MVTNQREALNGTIAQLIDEGAEATIDDNRFTSVSLELFSYQFEMNAPYRSFCANRSIDPTSLSHWSEIPALPTTAFKQVDVACFDSKTAMTVFESSGTTRAKRSRHLLLDLTLYEASLLAQFETSVLPDSKRLPVLILSPTPSMAPNSSLVHMFETVRRHLAPSGHYYVDDRGLMAQPLFQALTESEACGEPVALLGTTFAFVHLLDSCLEQNVRFDLPQQSRIMDTGGYKGRSREVQQGELLDLYDSLLGVPATHVVNEYGMTEMCSQFYDTSLIDTLRGVQRKRRKRIPPWVRTIVVDPETMMPARKGQVGLLRHFDLGNLDSVLALQTDDLGMQVGDGFEILGRATGAEARGCSISVDELLGQSGR